VNPSKLHQSGGVDTSELDVPRSVTYHYYCSNQPSVIYQFDTMELAAACDSKLVTSMLLRIHIEDVIGRMASGSPPYALTVPREAIGDACEFQFPVNFITIYPKPNREDAYAFDTSELKFDDTTVVFHALRRARAMFYGEFEPPKLS